jgi:hypothetical protein
MIKDKKRQHITSLRRRNQRRVVGQTQILPEPVDIYR